MSQCHPSPPRIIACGYREIQSPKTALTFPAWLIQLGCDHDNNNNNDRNTTTTFWRSKKDFLLLFRATKFTTTSSSKIQAPKAALNKLANRAPWRRDDDAGGANDIPNNFHRSMKRSILQLDQYLQAIFHNEDGNEDLAKAWDVFTRPHDTEGLLPLHLHICDGEASSPSATTNVPTEMNQKLSTRSTVAESCKLGQYFCSTATAQQIVKETLDFCRRTCRSKSITFVEPSCGHGDIVWQLLDELTGDSSEPLSDYRIVACDLDTHAIRKCQQHPKHGLVHEWRQGDFLQSQPSTELRNEDSQAVVCIGGPPYTTGAGSGHAMARDLPDLFLHHCIDVWKACFIAFILPERYRARPVVVPQGWSVINRELESSTFYFQGQDKVSQPSIIQIYCMA